MSTSKLLKKDLFGEIRRVASDGNTLIVRDAGKARPWVRWLARLMLRREARILLLLDGLAGVPVVVSVHGDILERSFLEGRPMQDARPDRLEFHRCAMRRLRQLHRHGVCHNDLAKEPNILVTEAGEPVFIDFQLASSHPGRGRLFRLLAYEDIRHLLKHKRSYCPEQLTIREKHILDNPSAASRLWSRSVKPVYLFITRGVLGWSDREGAGDRGRVR